MEAKLERENNSKAEEVDMKPNLWGVPIMAQRLRTQIVSMKMQVPSLASLSGLRTQQRCELCCRSQTQLGSCVAVAVA